MAIEQVRLHVTAHWWALAIRGIAGILFGIAAFLIPGVTLGVLVILFGAYALVDGVFSLATAIARSKQHRHWWPMIIEGVVGILAGLITMFWPRITLLALVIAIGAWAIVTGILEISAAIALRKRIAREWLLALAGVASIVFGVLLFVAPIAGAFVLVWWIGAFFLLFGAIVLGLAFRVRAWGRHVGAAPPESLAA